MAHEFPRGISLVEQPWAPMAYYRRGSPHRVARAPVSSAQRTRLQDRPIMSKNPSLASVLESGDATSTVLSRVAHSVSLINPASRRFSERTTFVLAGSRLV